MIRLLAILALFLPLPIWAGNAPVIVFAAASLRGALDEIAANYEAGVTLSFAGSGTIARQIAAGAPADVVILANDVWMNWMQDRGLLLADGRRDLAGNGLVLIAPSGTSPFEDVNDLLVHMGNERLAMGQRDGVPAGIYARQWLERIDQWDAVQNQLAETDNVRAALALVARGDTPLGLVYYTDAKAEPAVTVVWSIPSDAHDPITYPAAALSDAGVAFLDHASSAAAASIFTEYGFIPIAR